MNDAGPIYSIVAGKKNGSSLLLIVCKAHRWVKRYKKNAGWKWEKSQTHYERSEDCSLCRFNSTR